MSQFSAINPLKPAVLGCGLFLLILCVSLSTGAEKPKPQEPDYTKGEKPKDPSLHYCALGSTGATGYFWSQGSGEPTTGARMILIKEIAKGTPADGKLYVDDVILGIISPSTGPAKSDVRFEFDARKALSAAITAAETKENKGKLILNVWSKGKTSSVTLMLPVKGSFSATSPWDCEKTKILIDEAAKTLPESEFFGKKKNGSVNAKGDIPTLLNALGLLATGEEKYLPSIREYAQELANQCLTLDVFGKEGSSGMGTWAAGYRNLLLTEYYLITKDEKVLPGIEALSTYMALGQSGVGTWSHGMADVKQNGLYGPASAYGAMNQCSMTCAISLILAQKCGIKKKEIDEAVNRSLKFYRWYVDKGTVPYGDHAPAEYHDNNGKNSQAAVMFDLAGDSEAADFFARMTLASYNQRERGHTGNFFSWLWGALGAARGGPEAAQSFVNNTRWFTELERRPGGEYHYQLSPAGQEHFKYRNWSTTGCRLLQHCLPRKALYITGKGGSSVKPIVGEALKTAVDAATFNPSKLSTKELLASLSNWSIIVRKAAARELGERDDNVVKELIAMLDSPNRYARFGACIGLEFAGRQSTEAVDAMVAKLKQEKDMTTRFFIVDSLKYTGKGGSENGLGAAVKSAADELLKLAATYEPETDPNRKLHNELAGLLFADGRSSNPGFFPGGKGSQDVDRNLLIPAIKSILKNPNGAARSVASKVYDELSEADLRQLWGDIYYTVKYPAPSGVMFAGEVRVNGARMMANHHIKEGLDVAAKYVFRTQAWGEWGRCLGGIPALKPYGIALKEYFPDLERFQKRVEKQGNSREKKSIQEAYDFMKKTPAPALTSIEQYIKEYEKENGIK